MLKNLLFTIAAKVAINSLKSIWAAFWQLLFLAIENAEREWDEGGRGEVKKKVVVKGVVDYVQKRLKPAPWQMIAIRLFTGAVVDAAIKSLNSEVGQNWAEQMADVKQYLEAKIPSWLPSTLGL